MNQPITARKMAKQPPERSIRQLMAYFPYRGDKLPYTTLRNITAGEAAKEMVFYQNNTGYYLTWVVWWEGEGVQNDE